MSRGASLFNRFLVHVGLVVAALFALYPVLWVCATALSPSAQPTGSALPVPASLSLEHFVTVVSTTTGDGRWLFGRQLLSSMLIALATAVVAVAIATPAAYAFARYRFVGKDASGRLLLATQMVPGIVAAVPLFLLLDAVGLLDSGSGLVVVYATTAVPFAIFQLRAAFEAIPRELEEAAMVDGATRFEAFRRVALPAARPAIAVTALFAFMTAWNEFIMAATLLSRQSAYTLPIVLQGYVTEHRTDWGPFAAGAILVSVPVMALFYVAQRQLVSGLTSGGVKG